VIRTIFRGSGHIILLVKSFKSWFSLDMDDVKPDADDAIDDVKPDADDAMMMLNLMLMMLWMMLNLIKMMSILPSYLTHHHHTVDIVILLYF
jgi:hypothetical protein